MTATDSLRLHAIAGELLLPKPEQSHLPRVCMEDCALTVMTDFQQVGAVAVRDVTPTNGALAYMIHAGRRLLLEVAAVAVRDVTPVDEALAYMIHAGVRLLLVVDGESRVHGLVTAGDIQDERAARDLLSMAGVRSASPVKDVRVKDIMAPVADWEVLNFEDVQHATVRQVVSTFEVVGRRHLVVVEPAGQRDKDAVRGLFSASRLERQLRMRIESLNAANHFAGTGRALVPGWDRHG